MLQGIFKPLDLGVSEGGREGGSCPMFQSLNWKSVYNLMVGPLVEP